MISSTTSEYPHFALPKPCILVEVLATWVKFLLPSGHFAVVNYTFTLCPNFFLFLLRRYRLVWTHKAYSFWIRTRCTFICVFFKLLTEWSNAQRVSTLYNRQQWLPFTVWTASVTWYTRRKLVRTTKILQNVDIVDWSIPDFIPLKFHAILNETSALNPFLYCSI